jgi:signal transduction histidine kinase/ActR/RegA family two-component response regulator/predicted negative regulator of RcsB-dependent stress response
MEAKVKNQIESYPLTVNEQVKACCTIARERLEAGDYDEACAALQRWWTVGEWPRHAGLEDRAAADLLFTTGVLSGLVGSIKQMFGGQKPAEGLLNGAIILFDRLGEKTRVAEARVELAWCYYRQGLFDLSRTHLRSSLQDLSEDDHELKSIGLIRLAVVEIHTGRLHDAIDLLNEAERFVETSGAWTKGLFHLEFAVALKNLGIAESRSSYFEKAQAHYREALSHFEQIGNRRYTAIVENNHGYLLLNLKKLDEAQVHLKRARELFDEYGDSVRRAQVDETLAQLYLSSEEYTLAQRSVRLAVETLETSGEEALLAEALTTHGLVMCKLGKRHEAKPTLERARRVAERCGDDEGAGKPLLILIEEMFEQLGDDERREIGARASQLLANSQRAATRERLKKCLERIAEAHAEFEHEREQKAHAEKMAALGELSFGVAHNVNNTLTGILGRAQLLRRTNDPEKIAAGIDMIIKSADDGAHIIRRIQDFARKAPSREFEAVSVAELLKDVSEMARPRWESRAGCTAIRFALFADSSAFVMGDPVELREVLVNVIYNAVDAMPTGGEIRMSAQEVDDRVILKISDTGTGMTPEVKSRLFDPFFSTKGKAGTGMGLAVSFGIIRRHNGSIEVESEPGTGTTFLIALPKASNNHTQGTASVSRSSAFAAGGDRLRVLVVDDEAVVREVLKESLENDGCEVLAAQSGEEALRLYDENKGQIDLVFTDIGMSEMSGWELVTAIRKRSETIPLAIVSGWAEAISWDTRNAAKADWVISKPFDIGKISAIANEIADRKKTARFPN